MIYMLKQQYCKKCGRDIRFEFSIKDEIWNKLPKKWQNRVLCIECFLDELEKESPRHEFNLSDFRFLGVVGSAENNVFGGVLIS